MDLRQDAALRGSVSRRNRARFSVLFAPVSRGKRPDSDVPFQTAYTIAGFGFPGESILLL